MKLIVCRECRDTVALGMNVRRCRCGASAGVYVDEIRAEVSGPATAFGIHSGDLGYWLGKTARGEYPDPYHGDVRAWCMPKRPENIRYVTRVRGARRERRRK